MQDEVAPIATQPGPEEVAPPPKAMAFVPVALGLASPDSVPAMRMFAPPTPAIAALS